MQEQIRSMRIIAGKYRHRLISWPTDKNTRPTKDRIREALFSILGESYNKSFLDLYSGSGGVGLEALSRGYVVHLNDKSNASIKCIKSNISNLHLDEFDKYTLTQEDDLSLLQAFIKEEKKFDIIFLDPPYKYENVLNIIKYIKENGIISNNGTIILESDQKFDFENFGFTKIKIYKYGEISLYLMKV